MVHDGATASEFTLPGIRDGIVRTYSLREETAHGKAVLLVFYPFDFSPVCTNELCAIRDAEWFDVTTDVEVWAISGDSVYAHRAFAEEYDLNFALLSDSGGRVADDFDVRYDRWEDHTCVPKRSVVLVDDDRTVRYAWQTDDAFEKPDFFPVKAALDEVVDERGDGGSTDLDLTVDYDDGPGVVR